MRHRRLNEHLNRRTEWPQFDGTAVGRKLEHILEYSAEVVMNRTSRTADAYTLRLFDLKSREWSFHGPTGASRLPDVPMIGKFKDGVGESVSHEVFDGRQIYCRFTSSKITL